MGTPAQATGRYVDWPSQLGDGYAALQRSWKEIEAATGTTRSFQLSTVHGLLQTPDYARAVLTRCAQLSEGPGDVDDAVAARMDRQRILQEPGGKRWHLLLFAGALQHGIAPAPVMRAQIERLVPATALPALTLGIVPQREEQQVLLSHGFSILDGQVFIELYGGEMRLDRPEDVALHRKVFDTLAADAHYGEDARRLLRAAADSWA
ncbi:DUF5753 domain-containing protein [Streptomyces harbinensis]|uniref:DUF5753 domain-containing protein n=1 Tax=Streptomyces harbinensis TaxID=1176198 RepID=A0A1I6P357_9ACTN|nr:DUF5753 domain-containing protein [Streptomyces harbinensis]SFS34646.1 hypothetical protein SAMN05444716_101247 [Streptomyces harbinensis]